jgi:pimeloyl-ACP methyl ester carboxylesterase
MPFVEARSLRFFYQQKGSGEDVVLLHAFTSNSSIWLFTNIIESLAANYRVTAYDLRGHGATTVTPDGYDSDQMSEDFLAIHAALGLEPAVLIGHSFGGVIATHLAVKRPELLRGIIFSDTYFPGLQHLEPQMGQAEPWLDLRENLRACGMEIGEQVDFSRLFHAIKSMQDDQKQQLTEQMGPVGANWLGRLGVLADTTAGHDTFQAAGLTAEAIASIECPVLALYDEYSPFHKTREFLEANLSNIRSEIVPGAKHLAPLQSTEAFLALVQQGLREFLIQPPNIG